MTNTPDFFALKGYRLLASEVLAAAVKDLHGKSKKDKEWALSWLEYEIDRSKPDRSPGLRFQDCLDALGCCSRTREFRKLAIEQPEVLLSVLHRVVQTLREGRTDLAFENAAAFRPSVSLHHGGLFSEFPLASLNKARPKSGGAVVSLPDDFSDTNARTSDHAGQGV